MFDNNTYERLEVPDPAQCTCPICGHKGLELAAKDAFMTTHPLGFYRCPECGEEGHIRHSYFDDGFSYVGWKEST
jgi:hypothetical protein